MERGEWRPTCVRPGNLVLPLTGGGVDSDLTWKVANSRRYERVGKGLYVPTDRPRSVEQRILDAGARLLGDGRRGFVTGWAALRWRGAAAFDGRGPGGDGEVPVELAIPCYSSMRERDGVVVGRRAIGGSEFEVVAGLPVATPQRALLDEIHRRDELWAAVQAIDMAAAARLISVWLFATFLGFCNSRNGAPLAREAAALAVDECLSPREPWLRLVCRLLVGIDDLLVNEPVYTPAGALIGVPDVFDPVAGMAGEYGGEIHRSRERHRKDVIREQAFRAYDIECVEVVAGDSKRAAAERIRAARSRARFAPPGSRAWTLIPPPGVAPRETLDDWLARTGQVERLIACEFAPVAEVAAILAEHGRGAHSPGASAG